MSGIPASFQDFKAERSDMFDARNITSVDVRSAFSIVAVPSDNASYTVEIDAEPEDAKAFTIENKDGVLSISHKKLTGSFGSVIGSVVSGGVYIQNVTGANSVSIINGRVFIDGIEQKKDGGDAKQKERRLPRIVIQMPADVAVRMDLSGQAKLKSLVPFARAEIDLSGQTRAEFDAASIVSDVSGQSRLEARVGGGSVAVEVSGQSKAELSGQFSRMTVECSGQSAAETVGPVAGDYIAEASGMSKIRHKGQVAGKVKKDQSGMSSIKIG